MGPQKTPNSQQNSEKKRTKLKGLHYLIQITLQSYDDQNRMVLAEKQTHRPME